MTETNILLFLILLELSLILFYIIRIEETLRKTIERDTF